tara:strand:+ start:1817 stop:3067 length:1251 start_codon:yes stop_codon:yes gene_type:complete
MAVRKPLKIQGGNIMAGTPAAPIFHEIETDELNRMIDETIRQFGLQPGSTLYATTGTVSGSNNLVATLSDTRLKAGAAGSDATNFDTAAETQDVQTETTNFTRIYQDNHLSLTTNSSVYQPVTQEIYATVPEKLKGSGYSGASGYSYPLYRSGSGASATVQPMTRQDMLDTFWLPAVKRMMIADTSNSDTAGTFITTTASTLTNHYDAHITGSILGNPNNPVVIFTNTKANVSGFASGDLPETLDQATGTTNYYLQRRLAANYTASSGGYSTNNPAGVVAQLAALPSLMHYASQGPEASIGMRAMPHSILGLQLREIARYGSVFGNIAQAVGSKKGRIRYHILDNSSSLGQQLIASYTGNDSDGVPLGVIRSTITNTAYNSSTYRTQLVSDDYRSQEVPAGSEVTVNDWKFLIRRE